jgi:hypothetical protein
MLHQLTAGIGTLLSRLSRAACPELAKADATGPLALTDEVIE